MPRGQYVWQRHCVKFVHSCCWDLFDSYRCWQNRHLWTDPKDVNAVPLSHSAVFHSPLPVVIFPTDAWDCTKKKRFELLLCGRNEKYFIPLRSGILVSSFNILQDAFICLKPYLLALSRKMFAQQFALVNHCLCRAKKISLKFLKPSWDPFKMFREPKKFPRENNFPIKLLSFLRFMLENTMNFRRMRFKFDWQSCAFLFAEGSSSFIHVLRVTIWEYDEWKSSLA